MNRGGRPSKGEVLPRQMKDGSTRYGLRFYAYGKRRWVSLGPDITNRRQAEVELENILADVRRGIWQPKPRKIVEPPTECPTFWEFATAWVARHEHEVDPRTVEHWAWALNTHLREPFGRLPLTEITIRHVDEYKAGKAATRRRIDQQRAAGIKTGERGLCNRSINGTLMVLSQVLDEAIDHGHIASNPARGRKRRLKAAKPFGIAAGPRTAAPS